MTNKAAEAVISKYIAEEAPGYALLVDAPWGSGKTHIIKRVTKCDLYKDRLYITLYDVNTPEAFDWALVRAMNPWAEGRSSTLMKQLRAFVSGLSVAGVSIDLSKISFSEIVLQKLPETLIFDDVERCGLKHNQLSGLINRFVEHQRKRVILIANSEKHSDKANFDASREKLIGQTITIEPELEAAIALIWKRIPPGQGHDALKAREQLASKIFVEAGHQNLRLLLRAMRDAAAMLESLTPEMLGLEQSVDRLVMTFLALHMAYHGGMLNKQDMQNRSNMNLSFLSKNEKRTPDALEKLQTKHPECNIRLGYRDVFPLNLAYSLIVDGHAEPAAIVDALANTHQFSTPTDKPDWVRLWEWDQEPHKELEQIIARIEERQHNLQITEPGEILQIHAAEKFMQKFLSDGGNPKQARKTFSYINKLSQLKKIPPTTPASDNKTRYGFSSDLGRVSFQGYAFEPNRVDWFLVKHLKSKMDEAFEESMPTMAGNIIHDLKNSPSTFIANFEHNTNSSMDFYSTPILHKLDQQEFAEILLQHFIYDRQIARSIATCLSERRRTHRSELSPEIPWFNQMEESLIIQSQEISDLLCGQIKAFIRRNLTAR